ncbi:MAG: transcription termination factor NusA [Oscillospiraceae bacterium]|nr:transcription termination factor NusA [Oscillospiraceae bacterium]
MRRKTKAVQKNELNLDELFGAIDGLQEESGIQIDDLLEKIKQGILKAVKRDYPGNENVMVDLDPETRKFEIHIMKTVVEEEPEDPANEIILEQARAYDPNAFVGGTVEIPVSPSTFGRVAASSAKQSIRSDLKQFERDRLVSQYKDKEHEIVSATVQKVEPATGNAILTIDKDEIYFPKGEQIPGEELKPGDIIKVYVVGILNPDRKPSVKVSRTHRDFVRRLFELEVPEIYDGIVEIKAIAREPGSRSKIAVSSNDENVDAIGACIGNRRSRIGAIVSELGGEKIDLIKYSEDDAEFIKQALSPAEVLSVTIESDEIKSARVIVPESQLSLAIGNRGQNAKLAARLTGYKIDILSPESLAKKEAEEAEATEEPAAAPAAEETPVEEAPAEE